MLIGVDHGNKQIKTVHCNPFVSGLKQSVTRPFGQNALFQLPEFRNLDTLTRFCRWYAQPTSEPTEFNLYSETAHFCIWLRLITRHRDYNVYVHYYLKG